MAEVIPGVPADNSISKQQQHLMMLHYQLIVVYLYLTEKVRGSDRLPLGEEPPLTRWPWLVKLGVSRIINKFVLAQRPVVKHRPVTRSLVDSHIKSKLTELRIAYAEMEQYISDDDSTCAFRTWLKDTQDSLARLSATLANWIIFRRVLAALWPLVISLLFVGAVWNYIRHLLSEVTHRDLTLVQVVAYVLVAVGYILIGLAVGAAKKRSFFLAPISVSDLWNSNAWAPGARSITVQNAYEAEKELFAYIGKTKRLEPPLDIYLPASVAVAGAILVILTPTQISFKITNPQIITVPYSILLLVWAVTNILIGHWRSLR